MFRGKRCFMFGLLTRSLRRTHSRLSRLRNRTRLGLERLEARDCPDGGGTQTLGGPTIQFTYSQGQGHTVNISGTVTDDSPGGLPVTFSGVIGGTVYTQSNGSFSATLTASALGIMRAQTVDHQDHESNAC